jgi:hypothetical protein
MGIVRRQFLHLEGSATALFAAPYVVRSRAQAPTISVSPPLSARDRLEEAPGSNRRPEGRGCPRLSHRLFTSRPQRRRGGRRESACRHDSRSASMMRPSKPWSRPCSARSSIGDSSAIAERWSPALRIAARNSIRPNSRPDQWQSRSRRRKWAISAST